MADRGSRSRAAREARRRARAYAVRQAVHRERDARRRRDDRVALAVFLPVLAVAVVAQVLFLTAGPGAPAPARSTPLPGATSSAGASTAP